MSSNHFWWPRFLIASLNRLSAQSLRTGRGAFRGFGLEEMEPRQLKSGDVAAAAYPIETGNGATLEGSLDGGDDDYWLLGDASGDSSMPLDTDDRLTGPDGSDPESEYGGYGPYGGYAPIIEDLSGQAGRTNVWTFTGTVQDDQNVAGLTVHFGGGVLPSPATVTVQSDGTFEYQVQLDDDAYGTVTIQVFDSVGNPSPTETIPIF